MCILCPRLHYRLLTLCPAPTDPVGVNERRVTLLSLKEEETIPAGVCVRRTLRLILLKLRLTLSRPAADCGRAQVHSGPAAGIRSGTRREMVRPVHRGTGGRDA